MPAEPHPAAALIRQRLDALAAEYPFHWLAATPDEIVSIRPDLAAVIDEVSQRGMAGQVAFAYLNVGRAEG